MFSLAEENLQDINWYEMIVWDGHMGHNCSLVWLSILLV